MWEREPILREVFTSVQGSGSLSGYLSLCLREVPPPCRLREVYPPESKSLVLAGPEDGLVKKVLRQVQLNRTFAMEDQFLYKVEGNLRVRRCSEETQQWKGDNLIEDEESES
ncbi:hypothetical protein V6N11_069476 [Hibiscus sabdariffa]|uniref:Uncharacterized protein n=1 Tax=Hibiscus sabdariffa TaxID=183260 RepID=A0ABR2Q3K2_9ROSI